MNKVKCVYIIFLFLFIFSGESFASGGSIYTRIGIGDITFGIAARQMGFGEFGTAYSENDFLGSWNPASWSRITLTRFTTGLTFNGINVTDGTSDAFYTNSAFNGILLAVPIERSYGFVFSAGIVPYSNVQYQIKDEYENSGDKYSLLYEGDGGLSKLYIGSSFRFPFDVSIGVAMDYYIGSFNYYSKAEFENDSYLNSEFKDYSRMRGFGGTIGIISNDFSKTLDISEVKDLRLGFMAGFTGELKSERIPSQSYKTASAEEQEERKIDIPFKYGVGVSFVLSDEYKFVADYFSQDWSNYKIDGVSQKELKALNKFSFGMEYKKANRRDAFWEHVLIRGGLSYENGPYEIQDKSIDQLSFYAGCSLPIGAENMIDLAFQWGRRGFSENGFVKENIYKFNVSLSFGELWFVRTER